MRLVILAIGGVFTFAPNAFAETMTAKQIQGELIGKTLCINSNGRVVCARHNADGTSAIVSGDKQMGAWTIRGNKLCVKWEEIRAGKEMCSAYDKSKQGAYSSPTFGKITVK